AVVRHVDLAARAHGRAVRPAAERGDHAHLAVRRDARERAPLDLDQNHRAVGHRHGTFGKAQARRDVLERWRDRVQLRLPVRRPWSVGDAGAEVKGNRLVSDLRPRYDSWPCGPVELEAGTKKMALLAEPTRPRLLVPQGARTAQWR